MNSSSYSSEIKRKKYMKAGKLYLIIALLGLQTFSLFAQPDWVPGTPSIVSTGPLSITVNYGINMTGRIFIVVLNNASGYKYDW